jgi:hypothetical protein
MLNLLLQLVIIQCYRGIKEVIKKLKLNKDIVNILDSLI